MREFGTACMPLVKNVPEPKDKRWKKTMCPVCGCDCWETDTFQWAKQLGIIQRALCTKCALSGAEIVHDGFSNCKICKNTTCEDGYCSWYD